jgi:protease IV
METNPPPESRKPQEPPLATPVAYPPEFFMARRRTPGWARFLLPLLIVGFVGLLLFGFGALVLVGMGGIGADSNVRERHFSHEESAPNKVAIISVEGTIISGEGIVKKQIDRAREDESVKAVVLKVDSPGGTITGSDYIYHHLRELVEDRSDGQRKFPLVVSMGGLAASGGYYVSMAVGDTPESVFAEPTTWTGSIGVIIPRFDFSKLLSEYGIEEDSIASHRLKNMGSFAKPLTAEERDIFQGLVDESFARFKDVIQQGRPKFRKDPETLDKLATGQIYSADQAIELGLVDKIGFTEAAVDRAIELAGLDPSEVTVVKYEPQPGLADLLLGVKARQPSFDLPKVLELTAPRAYYLCTRIPSLLGAE